MKKIVAKIYYNKAKELYPNETNKSTLINLAEAIKISMNSCYGKFTFCNRNM